MELAQIRQHQGITLEKDRPYSYGTVILDPDCPIELGNQRDLIDVKKSLVILAGVVQQPKLEDGSDDITDILG